MSLYQFTDWRTVHTWDDALNDTSHFYRNKRCSLCDGHSPKQICLGNTRGIYEPCSCISHVGVGATKCALRQTIVARLSPAVCMTISLCALMRGCRFASDEHSGYHEFRLLRVPLGPSRWPVITMHPGPTRRYAERVFHFRATYLRSLAKALPAGNFGAWLSKNDFSEFCPGKRTELSTHGFSDILFIIVSDAQSYFLLKNWNFAVQFFFAPNARHRQKFLTGGQYYGLFNYLKQIEDRAI